MIDEMGVDAFLNATTGLGIDIFLPNKEEANMLTGETEPEAMARAAADIYGGALVILKLDADGALVLQDDQIHRIPAASNNLVDATGAGDSFAGAFLAHFLEHGSAVSAARFATTISAWVIEHPGARPGGDQRLAERLARKHLI